MKYIHTSVESLHEALATFLREKGEDFVKIHHKIIEKQSNVSRLEKNPDHVPNSCRIGVELHPTKSVKEWEEYQPLLARQAEIKQDAEKKYRDLVVESMKLEIKFLKTEVNCTFILALRHAIELFLLANRLSVDFAPQVAHTLITESSGSLLRRTFTNRQEACDFYRLIKNIQVLPPPLTAESVTAQGRPLPAPLFNAVASLRRALEEIFVTPMDEYHRIITANDTDLALRRASEEIRTNTRTEETAAILDNEMPADRATLEQLVRRLTQQETNRALAQHRSQPSNNSRQKSKNKQRGQPPAGASQKKKKARGKRNQNRNANRSPTQTANPTATDQTETPNTNRRNTNRRGNRNSNRQGNQNRGPSPNRSRSRPRSRSRSPAPSGRAAADANATTDASRNRGRSRSNGRSQRTRQPSRTGRNRS
jgi:hypothetical protein